MPGTEPHRPRTKEQRGFEQAVVDQVVHAADKAQHHQRIIAGSNTGDERAEAKQNNADVFQGVVSQQALDIMFHQRVQPVDKGGNHSQHQQQHAPPQRWHATGQRHGQDAVQTDLHHHCRKQRGGRGAGARMRLRRPAVQRDHPGEQGKTEQTRQPQRHVLRRASGQLANRRQIESAVERPHQPAGPRQQQGTETPQRKPQFAGLRAAGKERGAQRHDFRHHHQAAEVSHHHRAGGGSQQQVNQQAVGFDLRMTMPGNVKQRNRQRRQADSQQPQSVNPAHPHRQMQILQHAAVDPLRRDQRREAGDD